MSSQEEDKAKIIRDLLNGAIPLNQTPVYISRDEFEASVRNLEGKIENAALKQKLWVLSGVVAIMLTFGGGYISLVSKLDRLNAALPELSATVKVRGVWMQRKEQQDSMQDGALLKIDPKYQAIPYSPPPQ